MVDGRTKLTNVKVYISLQKVGAGERVGMEGWSELEEGWRRRRGGSEGGNAMHSIKWPEKNHRERGGEGRGGNDRNKREIQETEVERWRRRRAGGGGVGIRPPYIKTDRDRKGGL